jgi:hypothetical protein
MPIPDEPNTVDSQWASKFLNNIEKAGREGQVIPSVLVSQKLRVAIQVLLTSHKVIGKGVAWEDALTFKDMLRAVKNLDGGEFVRTPQTTVQKIRPTVSSHRRAMTGSRVVYSIYPRP